MKRLLALIICAMMLVCAIPFSAAAETAFPFTDVAENSWYYNAVKYCYENKYMSGTSATTFTPNGTLTRAMFVTILASLSGDDIASYETKPMPSFTDMKNGEWYVNPVKWALDKGVTAGMGDVFGVNSPLTREQMAVMLEKFAVMQNPLADGKTSENALNKFGDSDTVSDWARDAVAFVSTYGIYEGTAVKDGAPYFSPKSNATRAMAAVVIAKFTSMSYGTDYPVVNFTLNGNPIENYTIVYGSTASYDERKANVLPLEIAETLAKYIKTATGATLPVVKDTESEISDYEILIGETNREGTKVIINRHEFTTETLYVEMQGNYLVLASDEKYEATYYAMYSFLEKCMSYYVMGNGAEICIPSKDVNVENGYLFKDSPSAELRLNAQMGGEEESLRCGEITNRFCNIVHSLRGFSEEDYDPSWDTYLKYYKAGDPCLTDSDNIDMIIKNIKYLLSEKGEDSLVWVTQTDGEYYCKCANCAKVYRTWGRCATYIQILQYIGEAIKDEYPEAKLVGLPYKYTHMKGDGLKATVTDEAYAAFCADYTERNVPSQSLKCPDNVVLCVATDTACGSHSIGDENCNSTSNNAVYFDNELAKWKEISSNLYILDFVAGCAYEHMVFPIIHRIYDNFQKYKEYGVNGYYMLGNTYDYSDFSALKTYATSILMWNADMTEDEYYASVDRFLKAYYGNGWTYIREYIDKTEKLSSENEWNIWSNEHWYSIITPEQYDENIEYLKALFEKAISLADTDEQRDNCKRASVQIYYSELRLIYNHYEEAVKQGDTAKADAILNEFTEKNIAYRAYVESVGYGVSENWTETLNPDEWFFAAP